ncbi:hypothetical protein ABNX05_25715 [Lysinibacillus sp. M3]|uniref:VOC family protein n=1 Tax=Lysinibacillus zambalensis TaxID=3160866 RepID=A0ABV1MZQ1_9BACI
MKVQRIYNVGVIVNDLSAAEEFFLDFGLDVKGEWEMGGGIGSRVCMAACCL